jgi:DNA replication ATP-dependent helicase Dna2
MTPEMRSSQAQIESAIEAELECSSKGLPFKISGVAREGRVWKLSVTPASARASLDESLEDARAWWPGNPNGSATVLSVIPEHEQINLVSVNGGAPLLDGSLMLYPARYLEPLLALWKDEAVATSALHWLSTFVSDNKQVPARTSESKWFPELRPRQAQGFSLASWRTGFLWGPPGTGKTVTIGCIVASHLLQHPQERVLILSTTNSAVDQVLVAVDKALHRIPTREAKEIRKLCNRAGNRFIAGNYTNREHLLPVHDEALVRRLAELEAREPDRANVTAYDSWKTLRDEVRDQIRRQAREELFRSRVVAMTATRAAFTFQELREGMHFDWVVFDEASQVGLAHALVLAGLGKYVTFAGDPKQLAPIVQSDGTDAAVWLGQSMFDVMPHGVPYVCMLDEQWRMAKPVCDVVSNVFYGGELKVAEPALKDASWLQARQTIAVGPFGRANTYVIPVVSSSTYSKKLGGPICFDTASLVPLIIEDLVKHGVPAEQVLVLTPYRAQRTLIRSMLRQNGQRKTSVTTVHRAQGSERDTIIFDPVQAASSFLNNDDLGPRLLNVALSRAQARLILLLTPENRANPLLARIAGIIEGTHSVAPNDEAIPLVALALQPGFPECAKGLRVLHHSGKRQIVGYVEGSKEGEIVLHDSMTGLQIHYSISVLQGLARVEGDEFRIIWAAAIEKATRQSRQVAPVQLQREGYGKPTGSRRSLVPELAQSREATPRVAPAAPRVDYSNGHSAGAPPSPGGRAVGNSGGSSRRQLATIDDFKHALFLKLNQIPADNRLQHYCIYDLTKNAKFQHLSREQRDAAAREVLTQVPRPGLSGQRRRSTPPKAAVGRQNSQKKQERKGK